MQARMSLGQRHQDLASVGFDHRVHLRVSDQRALLHDRRTLGDVAAVLDLPQQRMQSTIASTTRRDVLVDPLAVCQPRGAGDLLRAVIPA